MYDVLNVETGELIIKTNDLWLSVAIARKYREYGINCWVIEE